MPGPAAPLLRLVPMTADEQATYLRKMIPEYAQEKVRAGLWSAEEADVRSREEIEGVLRAAPAASPHRLLAAQDPEGRRVGMCWLGPVPGDEPASHARWLYDIVVDESFRGRGYGRSLLAAAEDAARASGARELRLNVFRSNAVAQSLYRSSGYTVAEEYPAGLEMRKRLDEGVPS